MTTRDTKRLPAPDANFDGIYYATSGCRLCRERTRHTNAEHNASMVATLLLGMLLGAAITYVAMTRNDN